MTLDNLNHSSNKELRLPPVARRKTPIGMSTKWKIKGKKARVLWNADHSLGVITLPWSDKLTLIHKHILWSMWVASTPPTGSELPITLQTRRLYARQSTNDALDWCKTRIADTRHATKAHGCTQKKEC